MGVRIDREGVLKKDFQTAQGVLTASGSSWNDLISNRHYLADAAFLVGLQGPFDLLQGLHEALKNPVWPLYLGRKSYVPSDPPYLADGLVGGGNLRECLLNYRLFIDPAEVSRRKEGAAKGRGDGRVRLVLESPTPTREIRRDRPVSFALGRRSFQERFLVMDYPELSDWVEQGGA